MVYEVVVDISNSEVDKIFDYLSPFPVERGTRVLVPFGRRKLEGIVIGVKEKSDCAYDLKDIIMKLDDFRAVPDELLDLAVFLKEKGLRYIDCLRLFVPAKLRGGRVKILKKNFISFNDKLSLDEARALIRKGADAQMRLLERVAGGGEYETILNSEFNPTSVKALVEKGIFIRTEEISNRTPRSMDIKSKKIVLTGDQRAALKTILEGEGGNYLIHGVTGSGKTEIYLNVIESVLKEGKTAIMLVPEISLTPQMLGVFRNRFGEGVSVLHSGLSDGERYDEWRRLLTGEARVALGARSAVFAPVSNVGAIIIDEEHDTSYVSENNPRYFTSDVAEFRAKYNGATLILGSATPSVETYYKATEGEYKLITLDKRVNDRDLPEIETVDMRDEIRRGNLSPFSARLLTALDAALAAGEQAMLFLNRRGYASFLRCRSCGFVPKCPSCDVSYTYHQEDDSLRCHYCGAKYKSFSECPICGAKDIKEGRVGTEKVVAELNRIFPNARILRMDNDTTSTKDSYINILSAFAEKKADILVGTQMIAKGHDFPNVTLVGIIDADISLYFSDYRANERTFQLITQVAGRAGRENKPGRVIMQTYNPKHFVYGFATRYDYRRFYEKEINARESTKFPPFTTLARIMVSGLSEQETLSAARGLYEKVKRATAGMNEVIRVQVARSSIKKLQNQYRFQIVAFIKSEGTEKALPVIYSAAREAENRKITVFTEINPQNM